jgi:hypothetical protein
MTKPTIAKLQSEVNGLTSTVSHYREQNNKLITEKSALTSEVNSLKAQLQWVRQLCQSLSEANLHREKNR